MNKLWRFNIEDSSIQRRKMMIQEKIPKSQTNHYQTSTKTREPVPEGEFSKEPENDIKDSNELLVVEKKKSPRRLRE